MSDTRSELEELKAHAATLSQRISDLSRLSSDPPEATTRGRVIKILEDGIPRGPLELSKLVGRSRQLLCHLVRDMAREGLIVRVSWGKYTLPKAAEEVSE